MKRLSTITLVSSLALTALVRPARAQASAHLVEAQKAYAAIDYEGTRREAKAALEEGGHDLSTTGELYVLLGTSAAALERAEEARIAFSHALAANPGLKLDRDLSPKMRAPYQEARGNATSADGKPPLQAELLKRQHELELLLRDRLHVAASVELWARAGSSGDFTRRRFPAAAGRRLPLPSGAEIQYYLRALDRRDNVLFEAGNAEEPRRLALELPRTTTSPSTAAGGEPNRTPYFVTAASLAAVGLAAGGVATAMLVRREDAAKEWNGPTCEQPGATRREQCGSVEDRRRSSEQLAVSFAVGGGALLVGSLVTLLLTPPATETTRVAVDAGPQGVVLRLRGAL